MTTEEVPQWAMSSSLRPPGVEELPRLHRELGIWMSNTKYQLQPVDCLPLWRVQNTTMTVATGAGISAYYLLQKMRPGMKFPISTVPPFIAFYFTYHAAQASQMPGLYRSLLSLPSPLGSITRDILGSLRNKGKLPSDDYGSRLPAPGMPRPPQQDGPASEAFPAESSSWGSRPAAYPPPEAPSTSFQQSWSPPPEPPPPPAPSQGQWDGFDGGAIPPSNDPWATEQSQAPKAKKTRTWDEIRAEAARNAGK